MKFKILSEDTIYGGTYVELTGATYEQLDDLLPDQFDYVGEDPMVDPTWISDFTLEETREYLISIGFAENKGATT